VISAILLLLRQQWRTSINRFAEAMTLFAVSCAGIYPLFPRAGMARLLELPYPEHDGVWPQFRSRCGTSRRLERTDGPHCSSGSSASSRHGDAPRQIAVAAGRILYGRGLGWRGSARHWHRYDTAYLLLAGLATPLVVSVHTVVSFDFAVSILPAGTRRFFRPLVAAPSTPVFPMVLTLAIPLRPLSPRRLITVAPICRTWRR